MGGWVPCTYTQTREVVKRALATYGTWICKEVYVSVEVKVIIDDKDGYQVEDKVIFILI